MVLSALGLLISCAYTILAHSFFIYSLAMLIVFQLWLSLLNRELTGANFVVLSIKDFRIPASPHVRGLVYYL